MGEIQVDDWVRIPHKNREILTKVTRIHGTSPRYYVDTSRDSALESWYTCQDDNVELWVPKVGEWCWFYLAQDGMQFKKGLYYLGRFRRKIYMQNLYVADFSTQTFDFCEPFIGELPTECKEK